MARSRHHEDDERRRHSDLVVYVPEEYRTGMASPVEIDHNQRLITKRTYGYRGRSTADGGSANSHVGSARPARARGAVGGAARGVRARRVPRARLRGLRRCRSASASQMLAPKIQGRILQALGINPADRALEIGTGTGYLSACMSLLGAATHSIDIHPRADRACATANLRAVPQARVHARDARCLRRRALGRVRRDRRHRLDAGVRCALRARAARRRPAVRGGRVRAGHGGRAGAPRRRDANGSARACSRRSSIRWSTPPPRPAFVF